MTCQHPATLALASAAVALELKSGTIKQARVAVGGMATRPWRLTDVERLRLAGTPLRTRPRQRYATPPRR